MRKRDEILKDGSKKEMLILEVLLDIRDTLIKQNKKPKRKNKKEE